MSSLNATTSSGIVATADNTATLQLQTAGVNALNIDASQNVGIGTTSPSNALQITRSSGETVVGITNTATGSSWLQMTPSSLGAAYIHNTSNVPTVFTTNSTERMRISSGGDVSMGTSAVAGRLTVQGAYAQTGSPGLTNYTIDTTPTATAVANGASVDFTLLSGMLIVNSWNSGGVTIWLMGGGSTSAVSSVIGTVGTMSYVFPFYRWTNNTGSAATFGFFCVRTRTGP